MFFLAYNLRVPTPFYHLNVASEVLNHTSLQKSSRDLLRRHYGPFLFGNTAPDVQTISGQARIETHFFDLPLKRNAAPPWKVLFTRHPQLSVAENLVPAQAAFLAGYLCHLQADWMWVLDIFVPIFGLRGSWGSFPERLYLHNVLRAYLDNQILPSLRNGVATNLIGTKPGDWLPFVTMESLVNWHAFLADQLQPGADIKTIDVFAARQGIKPEVYSQLISSEARMEREVFIHMPRENLERYRDSVILENTKLMNKFLV